MTRVAALQLAPVVGDLAANVARATAALDEALAAGADLVVMPELTTSGYVFHSKDEARSVAVGTDHDCFRGWAELLAGRPGATLVVGFAELGEDALYNSAAVVDGAGVKAVYRKVHLWDREKEIFRPGDAHPPVLETPHGRVGVMICFDMEFPEWTRVAALAGADLLAVPTNWPLFPRPEGERVAEVQIGLATARMNHMAVVFADRTGTERGIDWSEGTGIAGADGWLIASAGPGVGAAWAEVDLLASRDKAQSDLVDLLGDRRPDLYAPLVENRSPHDWP
jgi:5-aminopentanamidase